MLRQTINKVTWFNWTLRALFPTPPPTITNLYCEFFFSITNYFSQTQLFDEDKKKEIVSGRAVNNLNQTWISRNWNSFYRTLSNLCSASFWKSWHLLLTCRFYKRSAHSNCRLVESTKGHRQSIYFLKKRMGRVGTSSAAKTQVGSVPNYFVVLGNSEEKRNAKYSLSLVFNAAFMCNV